DEHDGLVEAVEPFADGGEVDAIGVVLALEPGATDAKDRPALREVVERRRDLGEVAGIAERVGPDHEPEADPAGEGSEPRQDAPPLEDRLLPRPEDGQEVIPRPDRVPARVLGGESRVAEARPVGPLRPELEPESRHESRWAWIEVGVIRNVIRSWLSTRAMSFSRSPGTSSG